MRLHSAQSAILSAVIFNAVVIIALIPLALAWGALSAERAPREMLRNATCYIYGLGGLIVPFIGIKAIDLMVVQFIPGIR